MVSKVDSRAGRLLTQLRQIVREVDDRVLALASPEACAEWEGLVRRLPSDGALGRGAPPLSEDELGCLLQKATRFREILRARHGTGVRVSAATGWPPRIVTDPSAVTSTR